MGNRKGKATLTNIDAASKKVTLDHEAIKKFKMEAGTHDFAFKSDSTVAKVMAGDKVNFTLTRSGTKMLVTRLSKQK